jgi:hypothetical protein
MKRKLWGVRKINQIEDSKPGQLNLTKSSGGFISVNRIEALIKNSSLIRRMVLPVIFSKKD